MTSKSSLNQSQSEQIIIIKKKRQVVSSSKRKAVNPKRQPKPMQESKMAKTEEHKEDQ